MGVCFCWLSFRNIIVCLMLIWSGGWWSFLLFVFCFLKYDSGFVFFFVFMVFGFYLLNEYVCVCVCVVRYWDERCCVFIGILVFLCILMGFWVVFI